MAELKAQTVLVVEDNEQNLELAQYLLEEAGFAVAVARTGTEARETWRRVRPDLVLMDMRLPDADGLDLVAELRKDADLARLPIIALTAHAMRGDRERFLAAGCSGYIAKPIRAATFISELRRHLAVLPEEARR